MTRGTFIATSIAALTAVSFGALGLASPTPARTDCPGKIVCPLTGEIVCRDQCPRVDLNRPDCPGRIECPVNGELICKDRCPAGGTVAGAPGDALPLPACCAGGK